MHRTMASSALLTLTLCGPALAGPALVADAGRGARLFAELGCADCHSSAPPLADGRDSTPNAMAAAMWTHASRMWGAIREAGMQPPELTAQQAADIHAHLATGETRPEPGDAERGRAVFEAKLCHACHQAGPARHEAGAYGMVELPRPPGGFSAFSMMAALWTHGSGMLARMVASDREWQTLSAAEMADLIAFLNSR
jgi:cytochrome c2